MTILQPMLPCNTFAYLNNNNPYPEFVHTFIDVYGCENRANYFSNKSPNELCDMKGLVPVGDVYRVCW
jgi:hypothetical protein